MRLLQFQLQNFKTRYSADLGSSARAVDQSIESVEANIAWMDQNFKTITAWLDESNTITTSTAA